MADLDKKVVMNPKTNTMLSTHTSTFKRVVPTNRPMDAKLGVFQRIKKTQSVLSSNTTLTFHKKVSVSGQSGEGEITKTGLG